MALPCAGAVPSQALVLLNSEFVHQQAERWGRRIAAMEGTMDDHIDRMFLSALGRPPHEKERKRIAAFLQQRLHDGSEDEAWADLAHVLFNVKGFLFIR